MPLPQIDGYVIYDEDDQLFSSGTRYPSFRKQPKIWNRLSDVKKHLHMHACWKYVAKDPTLSGMVVYYPNNTPSVVHLFISHHYNNRNCKVYNIKTDSVILDVKDCIRDFLKEDAKKFENKFNIADIIIL